MVFAGYWYIHCRRQARWTVQSRLPLQSIVLAFFKIASTAGTLAIAPECGAPGPVPFDASHSPTRNSMNYWSGEAMP